jgi:hypothetical protein
MTMMIRSMLCILAATTVLNCIVGDEAHHDDSDLDLDSALLVASRERLEVCLQIDPDLAASTDQLANQLRTDLRYLATNHPDWRAAGLDGNFTVDVGCPGGPIGDRLADDKGIGGAVVGPGLRAHPTPYRLHVHALGNAAATTVLGDRPFARAIAELASVDDHRLAEVSTAVIARASLLGTEVFRRNALAQSLGLRALE